MSHRKKIRARDMMVWAVMTAITVFVNLFGVFTVQFHAGTALVILTGIGLGKRSGSIVGVLARLVCNFFTGQGPWTPWQMLAWGLLGGLSGLLFGKKARPSAWRITLFTFCSVFLIYGGMMNMAAFFMANAVSPVDTPMNFSTMLAFYAAGIPFDLIHGAGAAVCVFVLGEGMLRKMERVKKKYRLS